MGREREEDQQSHGFDNVKEWTGLGFSQHFTTAEDREVWKTFMSRDIILSLLKSLSYR